MNRLNMFCVGVVAFVAASCSQSDEWQIKCNVPEAWEGKTAIAWSADGLTPIAIDSTKVKDGKMNFTGPKCDTRYCEVKVYLNPANRNDYKLTPSFKVFVDSAIVTVNTSIENNKASYDIIGEGAENLWLNYLEETERLYNERKDLMTIYIQKFYNEELEDEGIAAAKNLTAKSEEIALFREGFIKENHASVVCLQVFKDLLNQPGDRTPAMLEEIFNVIDKKLQESPMGQILDKRIHNRKVHIGANCPDLTVKDSKGRERKLSDYIMNGKYTLVDIWASWCTPCRGEIPFIKRAWQKYHNKGFNVVSISVDKKIEDWKQALEYEQMTWTQLHDEIQESFKVFETNLIPITLLVDPEGKICNINARGGWLDAALMEIFN